MNPPSGSPASAGPTAADPLRPPRVDASLELDHLVPGARWRDIYQVGEQLPDVTYGKNLKAIHVGTMNEVILRSFRVMDNTRARIWDQIRGIKNGSLIELIEALEGEGRRVEVVQAPPSVSLREWNGRRKVSQTEIELVLRQLAQAVHAMHKVGLVHLNIRPETIFVRTTEGGLNVFLGGFETAALLQGDDPVEVSMDPFYAPPEAVGLYHYMREPALRAWDWWSLGRIVQELVLGRHVLGHILERDVSRETPELRTRAEDLLREQDHTTRAGAVEMMPAMDRDLTTLLRGLLSSSREGRWGHAEVESWLRKEPVKERYSLPRHERLFVWRDRSYTVDEAAEYFARAENWDDGITNLFGPGNPSTLAHFIGAVGALKKTKERFEALMKLGEATALQELPPAISADVVTAVVLKFLAGHHAPLLLRGRKIDQACLLALLQPDAQPMGLATVYGFTARAVVQQIEQSDAEVGRMLGELERIYSAAATLAQENEWLPATDPVELARLMSLCLEPEMALTASRAEMLTTYACSRDRVLDKLFKKKDASLAELAVIAFTFADPVRFGYVTHREWTEEQHKVLRERGERLAAAATWLQLERGLRLGPLVFGRWRVFLPTWFVTAGVVAFVGQRPPAYGLAGVLPVVALVVRLMCFGIHRTRLRYRLPGSAAWTLRSNTARCRREAVAAMQAGAVPGPRALLDSLRETNEEIVQLPLKPAPAPILLPPAFGETRAVVFASWVLMAALAGGTVWYGMRHPPKPPKLDLAWLTGLLPSGGSKNVKPRLSVDQAPAVGVKSIQSTLEELRRARREKEKQDDPPVKISWPFKVPEVAQQVRIRAKAVALAEQTSVAEEMAELLVGRYEKETVTGLIAVQVPTESGVGLMLYDGKTGKLADRNVFTIRFVPLSKSWIEIDSKKAIFLGGL